MTDTRRKRDDHPKTAAAAGGVWRRLLSSVGLAATSPCARELTPDEDLQVAYRASADGDLPHAAFHVACVLKSDPSDRRATSLLDRLITKQLETNKDPLDLALLSTGKQGTFAGTVATRAYILAHQNRWPDAIDLLRQLAHADPQTPWWKWGVAWLARPGVADQSAPDIAAGLLASIVMKHPGDVVHDNAARANLASALPAVESAAQAHPDNPELQTLHIMTLRKLGRLDEATRLADDHWRQSPSRQSGVTRGMVHKAAGNLPAAIEAFEQAAALDPADESVPADLAEFNCAIGRFAEALKWTEETKRRDPNRTTSSWTLWYILKNHLDPTGTWLDQLQKYQSQHPDARDPGAEASFRLGPWEAYIPEPQEATIDTLRQYVPHLPNAKPGTTFKLTLSAIEAPSSRIAADRLLAPHDIHLNVTVSAPTHPDPRKPASPVRWTIWQYDGDNPHPVLPPPPDIVRDAIASFARQPYDVDQWWSTGHDVAASLFTAVGSHDQTAEHLLAIMTLWPPTPDGQTHWDWARAVQTAAAITIARLDDQPWPTSARRDALLSLVHGPVDWTTETAIVALVQIYRHPRTTPETRDEIESLLRQFLSRFPDNGHSCFGQTLAWAVQRLSLHRHAPLEGFDPLWQQLKKEQS